MTWLVLTVAIVLEVAATSSLKLAGQGQPLAIAGVVLGYTTSLLLVAWVVQRLEVGIVYAIWSGIGTALVAVAGIAFFGEAASVVKLAGLGLVIGGVVVLNLAGSGA